MIKFAVLLAAAMALSACAGADMLTADQNADPQEAVYTVADDMGAPPTTAMVAGTTPQQVENATPGQTKPVRVYWFLGDR